MVFDFIYFSREHDYWLGTDSASGHPLLGIPVSNPMVDYIETYWIADEQYAEFIADHAAAADFADACRRREYDGLLTHTPGRYRGVPR